MTSYKIGDLIKYDYTNYANVKYYGIGIVVKGKATELNIYWITNNWGGKYQSIVCNHHIGVYHTKISESND